MKKTSIFSLFILSIFLPLSSCGGWKDNIKLSIKTAEFSGNGDSIIVTTKGGTWWISEISVDDKHYYKFPGVDVLSTTYIINQDCFVVERRDKYTLFIKLYENSLNINRIVIVGFEAGDYFDKVTITQKPKQ